MHVCLLYTSLDSSLPVVASPVGLVDRFGDDDLPPISEEPGFGEAASPECDRNLSAEVNTCVLVYM